MLELSKSGRICKALNEIALEIYNFAGMYSPVVNAMKSTLNYENINGNRSK